MWAVFISFLVALFFSGCGSWFIVPFSFQPSYWEFKELCKINYDLPKSKEKYNKILAYYGMSLDGSIDSTTEAFKGGEPFLACGSINKRLHHCVEISYKNKENKQLSFDNIEYITLEPSWDTRRIIISGNEGVGFELEWEGIIFCGNIR